jgi:hypothetical protein
MGKMVVVQGTGHTAVSDFSADAVTWLQWCRADLRRGKSPIQ